MRVLTSGASQRRLVPTSKITSAVSMPAIEELKRSEEHTSELQSLMRISYAVFCLKKKNNIIINIYTLNIPYNTHNKNQSTQSQKSHKPHTYHTQTTS